MSWPPKTQQARARFGRRWPSPPIEDFVWSLGGRDSKKLGAQFFLLVIIHHNSVIYTQEYVLDNPLGKHIGNRLVPKCFTGFQFRCRLRVTALCLAYWQMIQCFGSVLLGDPLDTQQISRVWICLTMEGFGALPWYISSHVPWCSCKNIGKNHEVAEANMTKKALDAPACVYLAGFPRTAWKVL